MLFFKKSPTIDSFRWDKEGWEVEGVKEGERKWKNAAGDLAVQTFGAQVPTGLPPDWRNAEALRAHVLKSPPPHTAMVAVDVVRSGAGVMCAQYITKEFMRAPSRGHVYMGMVSMPFREFYCNVYFVAMEQGTTGLREVVLVAKGKVQMPKQEHVPVIRNNEELEAMYRQAREGRPKLLGTDDEQWDAQFPDHPVSRVRRYLRHFCATLQVDDNVRRFPPFGG